MATVDVLDATGEVRTTRELPPDLFEQPVNGPLMHQVVVAGAAAQRAGTHSTKTRGEVTGGGRKPWRQKGTGRARQGSIRAPHWMGGGVSHGPKPRSYRMRVNRKMRKAAMRSALSDALASGKLLVIDRLRFPEPRTKEAVAILEALDARGRVLLVIARPHDALERSFRNLPFVKIVYPGNLGTYDLLLADRVVFTLAALDVLEGREPEPEPEEPEVDVEAAEAEDGGEPVTADEDGEDGEDDGDDGDDGEEDAP